MRSVQKHKLSNTKKFLIVLLVFIVLFCLSLVILYFGNLGPFAKQANDNNTSTKVNSTNLNSASSTSKSLEKTPINNQPTGTSDNHNLSAIISYINQTESSLKIGTVIDKVSSSGICELTIFQDNNNYTSSAGIQPMASSSTCKGFEVPLVELSKGTWDISIGITIGSDNTTIKETVTIK